jgi:hypothetical protein
VALTVAVELACLAAGLAVYLRGTRARDRVGRWGPWVMAALLVTIFAGGLLGSPPPDARTLALSALGLWVFVPLAWWVDRHRAPVARSAVTADRAMAGAPAGRGAGAR